MDHDVLQRHLAEVEQRIAKSKALIEGQHRLIAELKHDGHDTEAATQVLARFEAAQSVHLEERRQALKALRRLLSS
jgi:hypothetical protein